VIDSTQIRQLLTPKQILDAQEAGRAAYNAGESFRSCPHVVSADAVPADIDRVRALQLMWVRGYADEQNRRRYAESPPEPHD
jgi:hypothetical protein